VIAGGLTEARLSTRPPDEDRLAAAAAVYAAAFSQPPYHEGPVEAEAFRERVRRCARERDGFRFATACDDHGRLPLALAVVAARAATRPGFAPARLADELDDSAGLDALASGDAATHR
jgi:hypothetical protein